LAKKPKAAFRPDPQKKPKAVANPQATTKQPRMPTIRGGPLVWRFSSIDKGGPFAWTTLTDPAEYKIAMEKLHHFETMEETVIRAQGSHPVPLGNLCKEAQQRLEEIEHDDADELMSFRLDGAGRVWCRIVSRIMTVLWWDPEHKVCPSLKKHT
jgi:hypothetical protein